MIKLLAWLAIPSLVWAGFTPTAETQCSQLDLRNEYLGSVRNQQQVSWCYAFTAADMLNHAYQIPQKISAADVALGYNRTLLARLMHQMRRREDRQTPHETGLNKIALQEMLKNGYCLEEVLPSEAWIRFSRKGKQWIRERVPLKKAMLEIAALHHRRKELRPGNLPFYYAFENIDAEGFLDLLQNYPITQFYSQLRKAVCREKRQQFVYREQVKMVLKNSSIFRRISDQLERGRLVGLDYDSRILHDRTHRGVKLSELHTSSIVARRWNQLKQSCEFLVRDSYGSSCGTRYDPTYECDEGNIWLSESLVYPNMTSIVYLRDL
jgi:hypothetical protein